LGQNKLGYTDTTQSQDKIKNIIERRRHEYEKNEVFDRNWFYGRFIVF